MVSKAPRNVLNRSQFLKLCKHVSAIAETLQASATPIESLAAECSAVLGFVVTARNLQTACASCEIVLPKREKADKAERKRRRAELRERAKQPGLANQMLAAELILMQHQLGVTPSPRLVAIMKVWPLGTFTEYPSVSLENILETARKVLNGEKN